MGCQFRVNFYFLIANCGIYTLIANLGPIFTFLLPIYACMHGLPIWDQFLLSYCKLTHACMDCQFGDISALTVKLV